MRRSSFARHSGYPEAPGESAGPNVCCSCGFVVPFVGPQLRRIEQRFPKPRVAGATRSRGGGALIHELLERAGVAIWAVKRQGGLADARRPGGLARWNGSAEGYGPCAKGPPVPPPPP